MNVAVLDRRPETVSPTYKGFIDCDVHPFYKSPAEFDEFLPAHWREHRRTHRRACASGIGESLQLSPHIPG